MKILALWEQANGYLNTTNKLSLDVYIYIVQHTIFVHWIITYQALSPHERGGDHGHQFVDYSSTRRFVVRGGGAWALFFVLSQCL